MLSLLLMGCGDKPGNAIPETPDTPELPDPDPGADPDRALFDNNSVWKDIEDNKIEAQGGNIIKVGTRYHWFGMEFPIWKAVNHYSSADLMNWTKHPPALTPGMGDLPFGATHWVGRPYVMWNPNTALFVMAVEWNAPVPETRNHICFLTAPSIDGPWSYHAAKKIAMLPDASGTQYSLGDLGVYVEDDEAYLLYTFDKGMEIHGERNYAQAILKLDTDFMTPLPPTPENYEEFFGVGWKAGVQEAAAIIKRESLYYYFTSLCNGWFSSETRYRTSSTVTSATNDWTENSIVPTSPASSNSFNTQHDFIIPVTGSSATTYIYCGDRWNNMKSEVGGIGQYQWFLLTFDSSDIPVPTINAPDFDKNGGDWSLNLITGEWNK